MLTVSEFQTNAVSVLRHRLFGIFDQSDSEGYIRHTSIKRVLKELSALKHLKLRGVATIHAVVLYQARTVALNIDDWKQFSL